MSEYSVRATTMPIPFHEPLKVVAIVDREDPQTRQLLDHIAAEKFEIEVSDRSDRDVSEDAAVGAYSAWFDGDDRRKHARNLVRVVRAIGFNRFPGFNYEVHSVFQERTEGRIRFHTYVVRE